MNLNDKIEARRQEIADQSSAMKAAKDAAREAEQQKQEAEQIAKDQRAHYKHTKSFQTVDLEPMYLKLTSWAPFILGFFILATVGLTVFYLGRVILANAARVYTVELLAT